MAAAAEGASSTGSEPTPAGATSVRVKNWLPLESNPELMGRYAEALGFPTGLLAFHDVMSTDDWALEMIPRPVAAVVLLYPIKDTAEAHREAEDAKIKREGQVVDSAIYFTKQTVGNACGTIGLIHAFANISTLTGGNVEFKPSSWLDRFITRTLPMSPEARAKALEEDEGLEEEHQRTATDTSSAQIDTVDVDTHFIAFVEKGGNLYEMDGRKNFPINHGPVSQETLLESAVAIIRGFMERDPGEIRFTMLALAPAPDDDSEGDAVAEGSA